MASNTAPNIPHQPALDIERPQEFKTEFHPRSGCETLYQKFEEFGVIPETRAPPADEFSEIVLDAALNKGHVDRLLSLISRIAQGDTQVTLKNEADLRTALDNAAAELTPFTKHEITVPYKKEQRVFEVHARPLWDWALDLLENPLLAPYFVWDAQRAYKHNGTNFERFFSEPWTGDRWWDIQSHLPSDLANAAPFCFILYADKTKLSSHGTVKGYPVVAHCANLPVDIRNGEGIGGGRVVGWLPIIDEEASEHGKPGYINVKRVVWHKSLIKLFFNLEQYSKTGYSYTCYDNIMRWLFPVILILSADYEEQCMMSLIRGVQCKCPCPVCLVPHEELSDLSKTFAIRSLKDAQAALEVYRHSKTQGEQLLKVLGLRPVTNVFWSIERSDPHDALSIDRLHTVHSGMGGHHLLGELKTILDDLGREAQAAVEKFVEEFPQWRHLTHFMTVIHVTFTDGNKKRDLVMQVFYAALSVLTRRASSEGYCLLRVICSYLQLDSLIGLDVHTEQTLAMLDAEFLAFDAALKDYVEYATTSSIEGLKTDWNFPKAHIWIHARRDITRKGAARNFSTRPNEKLHGPLKTAYLHRSNGKDVAKQILHVDHHKCASLLLRGRVDTLDEQRRLQALGESADEDDIGHIAFDGHIKLGSPQNCSTIQDIEMRLGVQDRAFQGFRRKFTDFINTSLPTYGYQLTRWVTIPADFQIYEHHYVKVNYENAVDWRQSTDHLRCNPSFHGHPHFNCALIQLTTERAIFVRLILMFKCEVPDVGAFQFALVQPYTAGIVGGSRRIDRDLRLTQVKAVPRADSIIVPLKSFIRGALLSPDPQHQGEYSVVGHVDSDMFVRMKTWAR
ncbi:hypothetical protein DEU56DRAFT_870425 [Suillus clintonianus]|uniref:uncharacterized protein n=1 Tax=Suillus clintonianus TaxID=1904413 RepID=UPI001B85DCB3|nr:uncharacterized protein DEU56DRAFT_870425 [Suillus clintonianus]KAG2144311.1 hypothetical protein DEU56DRAFT_870425 [Suillus clintonianus]